MSLIQISIAGNRPMDLGDSPGFGGSLVPSGLFLASPSLPLFLVLFVFFLQWGTSTMPSLQALLETRPQKSRVEIAGALGVKAQHRACVSMPRFSPSVSQLSRRVSPSICASINPILPPLSFLSMAYPIGLLKPPPGGQGLRVDHENRPKGVMPSTW